MSETSDVFRVSLVNGIEILSFLKGHFTFHLSNNDAGSSDFLHLRLLPKHW